MSSTPEKIKTLLEDLGKPTMRGVRKCPKCGIYNGTRGIKCKNKACDMIFKESEKKKNTNSAEAVKIITGSNVQVFSVRVRDRGPDYRGFVQLPLVQDLDGNPAESVDPAILAQAARCYMESCHASTQTLHIDSEPCVHIKAAIECSTEAQPLTLKNSVLNALRVSNEIKQAIWLLATETTGPLVQRVTRNVMVVKCKPSPKQPLGFLHFAFYETSRNRIQAEHKFQCSCKAFKTFRGSMSRDEALARRCVHFYACVCAFASEDKLTDEFSYYINLDESLPSIDVSGSCTFEVAEVASEDVIEPGGLIAVVDDQLVSAAEAVAGVTGEEAIEIVIDDDTLLAAPPSKRIRKDDSLVQASNALLTLHQESNMQVLPKKPSPLKQVTMQKPGNAVKKTAIPALQSCDETQVEVSFQQWLGSITERINQTMHYQFDGNPEPLVFHAPQVFFDCLQNRISAGGKKKRVPNSTTGFVRKDALPLGTFTKYTWQITNILHVKQIFDTSEMQLDITRHFVENKDGTYDLYEPPAQTTAAGFGGKEPIPIRPFELKTYLKVGNTASDQVEPTPFIIEWIPDILPKSRIGELRIKFEYGHQRNGHIEQRVSPVEVQIP